MAKQKFKHKQQFTAKQQPTVTEEATHSESPKSKLVFYKEKQAWWLWVALVLTFLSYAGSLNNDFIPNWDDGGYILESEPDKAPIQEITLHNLAVIWDPTNFYKGNYHPLTTTFYMIEFNILKKDVKELKGYETDVYQYEGYYLTKGDAFWFHLINLFIHLLNVFLVCWLIWLITKGNFVAAGLTALFFGIHPMHVESVAWISERKDVLYTALFLGSMISYFFYAYKKQRNNLMYGLSIGLFTLSLFAKSAAVTLPVILLLLDWYLKRKYTLKMLLEKIPFFIIAFIFGILAILSQGDANAIQDLTPLFSWPERFMLASFAFITYLWKLILPMDLLAMYAYPSKLNGSMPLEYMLAPVIAIVIAIVTFWSVKKTRDVAFGVFFFLITISLVLQLLPVGGAVMAERYTYVPYIGIFFFIGKGYAYLIEYKKKLKLLAHIVVVGFTGFFIATTIVRVEVWANGYEVFNDVIKKNPNLPFAYDNLGYYFMKWDKSSDRSLFYYGECLKIDPNYYNALANRGVLYYNTGKYQESLDDFNKALKVRQDKSDPWIGRANTLSTIQEFEKSIPDYNRYMQLKPNDVNAYIWRGIAYYRTNKLDSAIIDFTKAITMEPRRDETYYWRAYALTNTNRDTEAMNDINTGLQLNPKRYDLINLKGVIFHNQKKYREALDAYNTCLQMDPNQGNVYVNRSKTYFELRNYRQAWADINQAGQLKVALDRDYFMRLQSLVN